jgi:hypothetical protein
MQKGGSLQNLRHPTPGTRRDFVCSQIPPPTVLGPPPHSLRLVGKKKRVALLQQSRLLSTSTRHLSAALRSLFSSECWSRNQSTRDSRWFEEKAHTARGRDESQYSRAPCLPTVRVPLCVEPEIAGGVLLRLVKPKPSKFVRASRLSMITNCGTRFSRVDAGRLQVTALSAFSTQCFFRILH